MDPVAIAEELEVQLRSAATRDRAEHEKRYLKSDLEFWGATVAQIRAAVKDIVTTHRSMSHDELVSLADLLWSAPVHERRMASVVLLAGFHRLLGPGDLPLIERLLRESMTWALVDALAGDVVGALVGADEPAITPTLDRWATDPDFWIRRSSLLAELRPIRAGAPLDRFVARADAMLEEREFFIRKAIGWVLREASKMRPDEVTAWLGPRTHRASGVTMREAVKYLPDDVRDRLLAAYRERRPAALGLSADADATQRLYR